MSKSPDEHYAQKIRGELGLRNDLTYVRELRDRADVSSSSLGTPLTNAEENDVESRKVLTAWAAAVEDAGAREPAYGGVWIDQKAGGILRVGVSGKTDSAVYARLTASLPDDQRVTLVEVAHSLRELNATQQDVTDALLASKSFRHHVIESSVLLPDNAVVLTVDNGAPTDQISALKQKYPALKIRTASGGYHPPSNRGTAANPSSDS